MSSDPFPLDLQWKTGDFGMYVSQEVMIGLFGVQRVGLSDGIDSRLVVKGYGYATGRDAVHVAGGLENEQATGDAGQFAAIGTLIVSGAWDEVDGYDSVGGVTS